MTSATSLQSPDNLFACKLGGGLGRGIIRRHEAKPLAPDDTLGARLGGNGRAPVPRPALVGNNRKFSYVGHVASENRPPRQLCSDVDERITEAALGGGWRTT